MLPVIFYFTAVDSHVYITVLNFILGIQLLTAIYTFYYMISTGSHYVISDFLDFCKLNNFSVLKVISHTITPLMTWWIWTRKSFVDFQRLRSEVETSSLTEFVSWLCRAVVPSVLWRCWLGCRKGIRPVKNRVVGYWHGYLSGVRCRLAYGPADATATHCFLLQ